jgi:outer membrane protein assembly factor BamB
MPTSSLCCPVCGSSNPLEATFCMACGKSLRDIAPSLKSRQRRLFVGSLITGTALMAGAGGLFSILSKQQVKAAVQVTLAPHHTASGGGGGGVPDVMFGFDAHHTGFNAFETRLSTANVSQLQIAWLSQAIGENYFSSAIVSGGLVYVVAYSGRLWAFDAVTGQTRWVTDAPKSIVPGLTGSPSTVAVVNGVVYFCLQDGKLYAFNAFTGSPRWNSTADDFIMSSPTIVDGTIYVTGINAVYAFDANTGHLRWTSSPSPSNVSPVAVANNLVYAAISGQGAGNGRVYALNAATGRTHWISSLITKGIDDNSSPTVANGLVYIGSGDGGLAAFDAKTGHTRWVTANAGGSVGSSPAVAYGRVYLSNNQVSAFNARTGQQLWISDIIGAYNADSTMVANGVVYVGSAGTNALYALDAATGKTLWRSPPTHGQIFTTPAVANGMVYLASGDKTGTIYAFHLPDVSSS